MKDIRFDEFVAENRLGEAFLGNHGAKLVFEFLTTPANIGRLIFASEIHLPVLSSVAFEMEKQFESLDDFPLTSDRNRQIVGRMARYIMHYFGYVPAPDRKYDKRLRTFSGAKLFKSATVYEHNEERKALMQIMSSIARE